VWAKVELVLAGPFTSKAQTLVIKKDNILGCVWGAKVELVLAGPFTSKAQNLAIKMSI
jgi:hypothetical protein